MIVFISIIIPTLNEAEYVDGIAETLAGMGDNCEIIIADGGSQDGTVERARDRGMTVIETVRGPRPATRQRRGRCPWRRLVIAPR